MKAPDMEKMIEDCKKKQRPDEEIVFAFGVGRIIPLPGDGKKLKEAIEGSLNYIKKLQGFKGIHPIDFWKNLLIFDTLNHAKIALNELKCKGTQTGNIIPILIEKRYLK